jgi:hypothetical protein
VLAALPLLAEPRLLLNRDDFDRIRKTIASEPWAARVRDKLIERADDWPASHLRQFGLKEWALPREGSGWSHSYVCPDHGLRLQQKGSHNLCPLDGKDWHGWPWDHVAYMNRHNDNAEALRDLGLAWSLTGNRAYVEKARRIVNAYSDIYLTLPVHDNNNQRPGRRGARVMSQSLSEASWAMRLVSGYDLVRDALPAAERERFERDVLKEAGRVIASVDAGKSNWQARHNAALVAIGLTVGDRAMVERALRGKSGFVMHTAESITPDGPWYEGAWGYHFFSLEPMLSIARMAERAGIALPEASALKRMFDAPLRCAFPDGSLPAFNDAGVVRLTASAHFYEAGYRLFADARYVPLLRREERGPDALLWGVPRLPQGDAPSFGSELLPDAGVATLRAAGSDHTLAIKFGPHGGGHGHYDKLTFVSFANGRHQAVDPGTQAYAAKSHATWDKMTVAHNTLVVDGRRQAEATGKLLDWVARPNATLIRLSAGPAYEGVEIERTVVHTAAWTLDVLEARATDGRPHSFDWVYHNYGAFASPLALAPYAGLPQENGYQHLTKARAASTGEPWQATFAQPGASLRVTMQGAAGTTVVAGEGLGPDLRVPVAFVMARRSGASARFVAVYEPFAKEARIRAVRERAAGEFTIEREGGVERVKVGKGSFTIE